jgi:hypothetical protein
MSCMFLPYSLMDYFISETNKQISMKFDVSADAKINIVITLVTITCSFLRNIGYGLRICTVSQPRIPQSHTKRCREPSISICFSQT